MAVAFFLYCLAISANAGESVGVISYYFVTLYGKVFFHAGYSYDGRENQWKDADGV